MFYIFYGYINCITVLILFKSPVMHIYDWMQLLVCVIYTV